MDPPAKQASTKVSSASATAHPSTTGEKHHVHKPCASWPQLSAGPEGEESHRFPAGHL